jgi:hypothetical protein
MELALKWCASKYQHVEFSVTIKSNNALFVTGDSDIGCKRVEKFLERVLGRELVWWLIRSV